MSRTSRFGEYATPTAPSDDGRPAPGKRTLTESLRGRERDVVSFDVSSEYREDRATIDGPPAGRLTDRQIRKARRRNPHWQQRLGFSTAQFGGGDIASAELAESVAERQAALGVAVDGIAGPRTIAALTATSPSPDDAAADADDLAAAEPIDDPFAMHLLDRTGGR